VHEVRVGAFISLLSTAGRTLAALKSSWCRLNPTAANADKPEFGTKEKLLTPKLSMPKVHGNRGGNEACVSAVSVAARRAFISPF
jgi:hypothetical protein